MEMQADTSPPSDMLIGGRRADLMTAHHVRAANNTHWNMTA
jgi:hypothetical protein